MRSSQGFSRRQRLVNISVVLVVFLMAGLSMLKIIEKPVANIVSMAVAIPLAIYLTISRFRKR